MNDSRAARLLLVGVPAGLGRASVPELYEFEIWKSLIPVQKFLYFCPQHLTDPFEMDFLALGRNYIPLIQCRGLLQ